MDNKKPLDKQNENLPNKTESVEKTGKRERMGIWNWTPDWLQAFNSIKFFVVILCIASLTQGVIVSGLTVVNLPTVEKEFGISSKTAGFIVAGNDASALLFVTAISFFGTKGHKPKWMGIGVLITGIGGFLYALPKLLIPTYKPIGTSVSMLDTCTANKILPQMSCEKKSSPIHVALLFVAQFIMGGGTTPLYTLGPTFLDENVSPRASPIYLGIWFTSTMLGPALGFVIGSSFLKIFTNIDQPEGMNLTVKDSRWIGAWWLGYVSISGLFFISGGLLLLFPKEMKSGREKRLQALKKGDLPSSDNSIQYTIKGYIMASIKICFNKVLMLAIAAVTIEMVYLVGLSSFLIKILIVKFGVPSYKASMILGVLFIPTFVFGTLGGSYIMRRIKISLASSSAAKICCLITVISTPFTLIYLTPGCRNTDMAGLVVPYAGETHVGSLHSKCNSNCSCSRNAYIPVCGSDGVTYHSPCFAGCGVSYIEKTKSPRLQNCSCINRAVRKNNLNRSTLPPPTPVMNMSMNKMPNNYKTSDHLTEGSATFGACDRGCKNFGVFIALIIPMLFIAFLAATPHKILVLRSVADNQRSFALGIQFLILRSLSFLPGSIIMGAVVDSQCTTWMLDKCGNKLNCADYNVDTLSRNLVIFALITTVLSALMYGIIVYIHSPKKTDGNRENFTNDIYKL